MERESAVDFLAEKSRPLPLIGVRASVWQTPAHDGREPCHPEAEGRGILAAPVCSVVAGGRGGVRAVCAVSLPPLGPLRRAAGERTGLVAQQRGGEVVGAPDTMCVWESSMSHLTSPTLRAGPLPLPRCAAERTDEQVDGADHPPAVRQLAAIGAAALPARRVP